MSDVKLLRVTIRPAMMMRTTMKSLAIHCVANHARRTVTRVTLVEAC